MPSGRFSTRANRASEKENVLSTVSNKTHKTAKPRQTWTAPSVPQSPSSRTPHRACKDLALARLLTPVDLDSSYECEITPPVNKHCFTAPRSSQLNQNKAKDLHSPLRRLRALSIDTSAKFPSHRSASGPTESTCLTNGGKRRIGDDDTDSDYGAETGTDVSLSSDEDESTTDSEVSSLSDEPSDSSSSVEWMHRPRRRPKVKCITSVKLASAKLTPRSATCSTPRARGKPSNRVSMRGSSVPCRVPSTPVKSDEKALPGREVEFDTIYTFISERLSHRSGGCMYISGLPGTGKTASVNAVLSAMSRNPQMTFQKVEVNGMQVSEPKQVYAQIYQQLTGKLLSAKQAADKLDHEFGSHSGKSTSTPVVLLIDELDLLCTRRQDVLYRLFDWPSRPHAGRLLIVLTIANTMDLPDRLLHPRVASRLGMARLTFAPYTHEQLVHIIRLRLADTTRHTFQEQAVELAARKVAAVSGDVRRALDICRRAAEMVPHNNSTRKIGIEHINAALKEMFSAPKVNAIRSCSVYEKLFLRALVAELQARNAEEARLDRCILQMCSLCRLEGFACPATSEVFDICAALGAYKLLLTESPRRDSAMLIRLNCTRSDVLFALKSQPGPNGH